MTIQIYCALIASVLLVLWTGRKPTLRQWEALQLYWPGWVTLEEWTEVLTSRKNRSDPRGDMTPVVTPGAAMPTPISGARNLPPHPDASTLSHLLHASFRP